MLHFGPGFGKQAGVMGQERTSAGEWLEEMGVKTLFIEPGSPWDDLPPINESRCNVTLWAS